MCELVKALDYIASQLIKKEHKHIKMTDEDKVKFVNASLTIQTHSEYLKNTIAFP